VTGVLLWLVRGSGTVYRLHCVTLTVFTASESSWRRFCLVETAAHSNYVFLRITNTLTYLSVGMRQLQGSKCCATATSSTMVHCMLASMAYWSGIGTMNPHFFHPTHTNTAIERKCKLKLAKSPESAHKKLELIAQVFVKLSCKQWNLTVMTIIIISSMLLVENCCRDKVPQVSTILCYRHVVCRPMLVGFRLFSTVWVHVCLGRPRGHFQSAGGPRIATRRVWRWSISGSDLAKWLKSCSRLRRIMSVAWVQPVRFLISQLLIWWL